MLYRSIGACSLSALIFTSSIIFWALVILFHESIHNLFMDFRPYLVLLQEGITKHPLAALLVDSECKSLTLINELIKGFGSLLLK